MTPNPVCYNGLNIPDGAIHVGRVSLGIDQKDYRADTAQNWRAGIHPDNAIVLYSNTFDLGLSTEAQAEPRIWWIQPDSNVADFKLKINELLSRLPERAANNYQLFATYDDAMDWLHSTDGKYALINDSYPDYYIPGDFCIFNIESGFLASYVDSGLHIHSLANPNVDPGSSLNSNALSWHGFTLTNVSGNIPVRGMGSEPGLAYSSSGHILSIDDIRSTAFDGSNVVFEAVIRLDYLTKSTPFVLLDSSTNAEVLRIDWNASNRQFIAYYPLTNATISFEAETSAWTDNIHLVVSVPASNDPTALENTVVFVNGSSRAVATVSGTDFELGRAVYVQIGNDRALNSPIVYLKSAKMYIIPIGSAGSEIAKIKARNTEVFNLLYVA